MPPDVLRDLVGPFPGGAGGGEHQIARLEVLDDIHVVVGTLAGEDILGGVVNLEDDVAAAPYLDIDPQLEDIHAARRDRLARLAGRPALQEEGELAGLLRGRDADLEVLGHRLTGVKGDREREADLPAERQQPLLLALDGVGVVEGEGVEHVPSVGDGDREDGGLPLLDVGL